MLISYYKDNDLTYTNRKRYRTFSKLPSYQEEQRSVLLGDGATTSIKTSVNHICNYVTIYNDIDKYTSRWYVTSYVYLNGGQVRLNLQRDVIGEFGISECYGKIERGYTDTILKNKKELRLNQILKSRKKLTPTSFKYGNYVVNTHSNELWGIIYFVKRTEYDPNTGNPIPAPTSININIPAFAPASIDYDVLPDNAKYVANYISRCYVSLRVRVMAKYEISSTHQYFEAGKFNLGISFNFKSQVKGTPYFEPDITVISRPDYASEDCDLTVNITGKKVDSWIGNYEKEAGEFVIKLGEIIAEQIGTQRFEGYSLPLKCESSNQPSSLQEYDNIVVKKDDIYYHCNVNTNTVNNYGYNLDGQLFLSELYDFLNDYQIIDENRNVLYSINNLIISDRSDDSFMSSVLSSDVETLSLTQLSAAESGTIVLDMSKQLVDEPYIVNVFPLFTCTIDGAGGERYRVTRTQAFMIFNTVIQYLSGENGYIVDAQVYPYCPDLTGVTNKFKFSGDQEYPIFAINSTAYDRLVEAQLYPDIDVKKEYIQREYSIISPDKTGKFTFNFYDYISTIDSQNMPSGGKANFTKLNIIIKTALKPFGIIASAVIQPENGTLMNMTYESDIRGCQPTANGFECSLSSNAFETYRRQNSTYQQLFELDKEELKKQHNVERMNDAVGAVVNTVTAATMGAIGGASIADAGLLKLGGSKAFGAGIGAGAAGAVVGSAMAGQFVVNEELRNYEKELQQQRFDYNIQAIQNLPNEVSRISAFNEIMLRGDDFWFVVETYECSDEEKQLVNSFIERYGYSINVYDYISKYVRNGWFIRSTLVSSNYAVNLSNIARNELAGGVYIYE